jgi:hypothetical protein
MFERIQKVKRNPTGTRRLTDESITVSFGACLSLSNLPLERAFWPLLTGVLCFPLPGEINIEMA